MPLISSDSESPKPSAVRMRLKRSIRGEPAQISLGSPRVPNTTKLISMRSSLPRDQSMVFNDDKKIKFSPLPSQRIIKRNLMVGGAS
jgi:hypothetical protein